MKYLADMYIRKARFYALVLGFLLCFGVEFSTFAQVDSFGSVDRMYVDNVYADAGNDVVVHFYMQNDEPISSVSIPMTYNTDYLTLKNIDFVGSRIEYIANKMVSPSVTSEIDGHFLVSFFIVQEDAVPSGDGLLFSATFTVADSATKGESFAIDTLFYPPGGEFIFVEATQSAIIVPSFEAGAVKVGQANVAPTIFALSSESVFEGDSINFVVSASDVNNDSLVFVCSNKPSGSNFEMINSSSASFSWKPDFVGPYSSDGSPFKLNLWVSDGQTSAETEVLIHVVNKNRKPTISTLSNLEYTAGDNVELVLDAVDEDFDILSWDIVSIPSEAIFTEGNQSVLNWQTTLQDTGYFPLQFVVSDPYGFSDTLATSVYLSAVESYDLTIGSTTGYPGDQVSVDIDLKNMFAVGSFDLLLHYDPSALSLISVTNDISRSASFEYFTYTDDENNSPGNLRIIAIGDLSGTNATLLDSGAGSIATMNFNIFGDISLSGNNIPLNFIFLDAPDNNDNTLTDTLGEKIVQGAITYTNGSVLIESLGDVHIGDINLNGIAYDIGDAIYFTNYFMNPFEFPFDPLQYANSDINHDNIVASIADLVSLINIIANGGVNSKVIPIEKEISATIYTEKNSNGIALGYETDFPIGGLLVTVSGSSFAFEDIENMTDNMTIDFSSDAKSSRILVYSLDGNNMPEGTNSFVQLHLDSDIEILSVEVASADGVLAIVETAEKEATIPTSFELSQNYPNPFNPETHISFSLPEQTKVTLEVFNVLGKKVRVLINDSYAAGQYEVVWDGRNNNGSEVASGVYFYRMQTEKNYQTKKMLLLK